MIPDAPFTGIGKPDFAVKINVSFEAHGLFFSKSTLLFFIFSNIMIRCVERVNKNIFLYVRGSRWNSVRYFVILVLIKLQE